MFFLICACLAGGVAARETRVHAFEGVSPELVERQIRMLIPERQRVSMNPRANQVIVVAEPETQERVASMLRELSRPVTRLRLWIRHNLDTRVVDARDGTPITLPVSKSPPPGIVERGRGLLPPGRKNLPVAGTVLRAHVKLLREDPAVARLRIVPTLLFGAEPPYEVVRFERLRSDMLINTRDYVDLPAELSGHSFYPEFFRTRSHPDHPGKPVGLLVSFEEITAGEE